MAINFQCLPTPLLPIGMFIAVYISTVRLPSLIGTAPFYIYKPSVSLPDSFRALYLEVQTARTGQGGVVGQREKDAVFRFQLSDDNISRPYLYICISPEVFDTLQHARRFGGE